MRENGGSAFPCVEYNSNGEVCGGDVGMSRREYFAAKALQGMLANPQITKELLKAKTEAERNQEWYVQVAYQFADEMIKQKDVYEK